VDKGLKINFSGIFGQLAGDSFVYGLLFALTRSLGIITFPIISRIFVPEDYGALDLIGVTAAIISSLVTLGISGAVFRYFYEYDDIGQITLISTSFWFQIVITFLFVSLILFLATNQLSLWLFKSTNYVSAVRLSLITIPFAVIDNFLIDIFRLTRRKWAFLIFSLSGVLLTVLLTVIFVVQLKMGINGALLSALVVSISFGCVKLFYLRRYIKGVIDCKILKKLLIFGLPLVLSPFLLWIMNSSNRYVMRYYTSLNAIGLFATSLKVASVVSILFAMLQYAWSPIAYSIFKEKSAPEIFARVLNVVAIVSTFTAMAFTIFAKDIIALLAPSAYLAAYATVGPLAFAVTVHTIFYMLSIGALIGNQPKQYTYAYMIGAIASIILNIIFVPLWGGLGASIALFLSYSASTIFIYNKSQEVYQVPYEVSKLVKIVSIGAILSFISVAFSVPLFVRILIVTLYPGCLVILKIISKAEITSIVKYGRGGLQASMSLLRTKN
jgi:O-antigen/teichoic acid export membrane protein